MISLRDQISQMLIMGFSGTTIEDNDSIKNCLRNDGIGGVLLFDYDLQKKCLGKNLVNATQIRNLTTELKQHAQHSVFGKAGIPLFIAVDYEGGAVDRLRHIEGCMLTKKPAELARLSAANVQAEANKMAKTLQQLGFNLNFAPVVDLNLNEEEGIIGKLGRSFSSDPHQTAEIAKIFVEAFAKQGITCCYKHFPGHGSARGDTHEGFVDVTDTYHQSELEPYSLLLMDEDFPAMIMTAHVINRKLDVSGLPATLSKTILTNLLRQKLKFDGVIISDDLQMQAISKHYSLEDSLSLTINAGADMLIFANQLGEIRAEEIINKIECLVNSNIIAKKRIEQAYQRIVRLKQAQLVLA